MKWDNWFTRRKRKMEWRRWFAWHPVTLGYEWPNPPEGQTVWLEWVERRAINAPELEYIYRQK